MDDRACDSALRRPGVFRDLAIPQALKAICIFGLGRKITSLRLLRGLLSGTRNDRIQADLPGSNRNRGTESGKPRGRGSGCCTLIGLSPKKKFPKLTLDALIRNGFFPTELAPLFSSAAFADQLSSLADVETSKPKHSRCITFSIPKSYPARRVLSIPNPLHQIQLASTMVEHWTEIQTICDASTIALSTPTVFPTGMRAVSRACDFGAWSATRFQRSANRRFVLRTDLSRFYHTHIYP